MTTPAVNGTPASAVFAAINTANTASATSTTSTANSSDQLFLKLLTTQLKNQDPTNPLDNAQMTSQLAQISTVDGITKLNATLQTLLGNANASQSVQAAALVGQSVMVPGSGLTLPQAGMATGAVGGVNLAGPADTVTATIKDASGATVQMLQLGALPAGSSTFTWDGNAANGSAAPAGAYTVSVAATQAGSAVTATAQQVGVVSSVMNSSQGVSLNVGSLGTFQMSAVTQIF